MKNKPTHTQTMGWIESLMHEKTRTLKEVAYYAGPNAGRVIRAVNCHEELVGRLHTLIASLESIAINIKETKGNLGGRQYSIVRMIENDCAIGKEAIAHAEASSEGGK
jgi:hypothetical protein